MKDPAVRWIVAVVAALAVAGLIAYARGEPGDDGRDPDGVPIEAALVVDVPFPAAGTPVA